MGGPRRLLAHTVQYTQGLSTGKTLGLPGPVDPGPFWLPDMGPLRPPTI